MRQRLLSIASRCYLRLSRGQRLVIVTCHRVAGSRGIDLDHLDRCLSFLAENFELVSPSTLTASRTGRPMAMLTIDDCHWDIYRDIYPVALRLEMPFVICTPTDFFLRGTWLWFDQVSWLLDHVAQSAVIGAAGKCISPDTESIGNIKMTLKGMPPAQRNVALEGLFEVLEVSPPASPTSEYRPVGRDEMREMLSSGLADLCGHTVSHTVATVLPDDALDCELRQGKAELESFSGSEVISFCYPNGNVGDFDERTARAVKAAGHELAFTSIEGTNLLGSMDPLCLKRVHVHPRYYGVFAKRCTGLGDLQQKINRGYAYVRRCRRSR
jgi:peptidoglycan/xylan/chitin deacetylase (PgdA/CDA1 family)